MGRYVPGWGSFLNPLAPPLPTATCTTLLGNPHQRRIHLLPFILLSFIVVVVVGIVVTVVVVVGVVTASIALGVAPRALSCALDWLLVGVRRLALA
jgi:hypothetical protein